MNGEPISAVLIIRDETSRLPAVLPFLAFCAENLVEDSGFTDGPQDLALAPPGHAWELLNLFLNGTWVEMLRRRPDLRWLMLHNIDTLGATLDPACLAAHLASGAVLSCEVIERLSDDAGGSLALVEGRPRLIEGLAIPDEAMELRLRQYNSNTWWVDVPALLASLGLTRADLEHPDRVASVLRAFSARLPTYVTIKEVRRRWGRGQVDVFPVAQFEQVWGDVTCLADLPCAFIQVPRRRGQQLKEVAQLPGWHLDGSRDAVAKMAGMDP